LPIRRRIRLKQATRFFHAGDVGNGFYSLEKGLLKVNLASPEGDDVIIAILTPKTVVGDLAVIDGMPRAASVAALLDCDLYFVSKAAFERCAGDHPEIYLYIARILAARLREANEAIASRTFLTTKGRVARTLLGISEILGQPSGARGRLLPDTIRQRDIAALAGVARETANRILGEWERSKLVTKAGHFYLIADTEMLARELDGRDR
jgi:CRP/FNR family transcriptional regulator